MDGNFEHCGSSCTTTYAVHLSIYDLQIESIISLFHHVGRLIEVFLSIALMRPSPLLLQGTVFGTWGGAAATQNAEQPTTSFHSTTKGKSPAQANMPRLPTEQESVFMVKYVSGYLWSKSYMNTTREALTL